MAEVQSVRQLPPEFIEAASKTYIDDLQKAVGDFKTQDLSQIMGRQFVAGPGALTTQAEALAPGLGGFQPFLTEQAEQLQVLQLISLTCHLFNKMLLIQRWQNLIDKHKQVYHH